MLENKDREKNLEKRLYRVIKDFKGWAIKLLPFEISGLPDRMILMPGGRVFFTELKTKGKKPTPIQRLVHRKFESLGFPVTIIDSRETLDRFIEKITNERL